jgi:ribonuclease HII
MPTFNEEERLWKLGYRFVLGIDEVGRGAFAGPLVAAAVVFPQKIKVTYDKTKISQINDSKLISSRKREELTREIKKHALCYSITKVSSKIIDKKGISFATQLAFKRLVEKIKDKLETKSLFVVIDGFGIKQVKNMDRIYQKAIIKGDQKSLSIAAASIIAKVYRDKLMKSLGEKFPEYGFEKNKGYGTLFHRKGLEVYGLSSIHRASYKIMAEEKNYFEPLEGIEPSSLVPKTKALSIKLQGQNP